MDSAHCLRFFRDLAAFQAVQEELAAGRTNILVMVVDDKRVHPRDMSKLISIIASYCLGAALGFRGVRQCRKVWIGVRPWWTPNHSRRVRLA